MKRSEKMWKIKMLYELESLVNKRKKTPEMKRRIKAIRETIDVEHNKAPGRTETFDLKLFNSYVKKYPNMTYDEIAKLMGIKPNTLYVARKRHGLVTKRKAGAGA